MVRQRVVVAGIGNIFLGDDGFGVEVAKRLSKLTLPEWVRVGDYGIRGMHLAFDLADGAELAILVDAAPRGGKPGTVYVIEPDRKLGRAPAPTAPGLAQGLAQEPPIDAPLAGAALIDGHGMQPDVVLGVLDMLGAKVGRMLIVGCEPATVDYGIGLSAPVAGAVNEAVQLVLDLIGNDQRCLPGGRPPEPRRGE